MLLILKEKSWYYLRPLSDDVWLLSARKKERENLLVKYKAACTNIFNFTKFRLMSTLMPYGDMQPRQIETTVD